jgi:hypothetical protein
MRIGGWAAYVSGVVAAIGLVFLIALYVSFFVGSDLAGVFGWVNDALVMVQYAFGVPLAVALHTLLRPRNPRWSRVALAVGITGMAAVVVLQALLVLGVLTFQQQIVPLAIALLVGVGTWLVATGYLARAILPHSLRMSLLAVPYLGYPIWAFWMGTHLLSRAVPGQGRGA